MARAEGGGVEGWFPRRRTEAGSGACSLVSRRVETPVLFCPMVFFLTFTHAAARLHHVFADFSRGVCV